MSQSKRWRQHIINQNIHHGLLPFEVLFGLNGMQWDYGGMMADKEKMGKIISNEIELGKLIQIRSTVYHKLSSNRGKELQRFGHKLVRGR